METTPAFTTDKLVVGKVWCEEWSVIHQTKLVLKINDLLAYILIRHFFHQMFKKCKLTGLYPHQTFPLYHFGM